MHKKHLLLLFIFVVSFFKIHSQEKNETFEELINKYNDYFLLEPETFYTQINKDKYFKGESIWFKSYVYNTRNFSPYFATKNIHTSIYNSKGVLVEKKVFYAEDGTTFGHFSIDDKYSPGKYYLKTTSTWMGNFNEDRSHIKAFEILNDSDYKQNDSSETTNSNKYDFKILPEGGHALNNAINVFGFKVNDNLGNGIKILNGIVYENDKPVTTLKNNRVGIGKFKCLISNTKKYTIKAELDNGEIITKEIDNIENLGIAISTENIFNKSHLIIELKTNENTLQSLLNKTYYLTLNRDGFLKKIDVQFESNKLNYLIRCNKELMVPGINILTLFNDEGKAISERILFNPTGLKIKNLPSASLLTDIDSTSITYSLNKGYVGAKGSLSVSVLPKVTKSKNSNASILSTLLLSPYTKGKIENPEFYFNNLNRESLYNIDLLLITQGWSKYSWNNIFYKPQLPINDFEIGFTIKGKVNNHKYNSKEKIILISKSNGIQLESKLSKANSFEFKNLFISDSSDIQFSLQKNKQTKPNIYYTVNPHKTKDSILINFNSLKENNDFKYINDSKFNIVYKNPVVLDTVLLNNTYRLKKPKNRFLQGSFGSKYISFNDNNRYGPATFVTDVIKDNGFDVFNTGLDVTIRSRRVLTTSSGAISPTVFIDNVAQIDFRFLASLRINEIEEMSISQRGNLIGSAGAAGVIQIFTKTSFNNKSKSKFNSHISKNGYSKQKEYYSPNYDKLNYEAYSQYGVIYWEPMIKENKKGELVFKIPNYKSGKINIYIEGMTEDGSLISKIETITLK